MLLDRIISRVLSLLGLDFDLSLDGLDEPFHAITPTLTLGARPRPEQVEALKAHGVTHVVSCLPEGKRAAVAFLEEHFETLFLPLRDGVNEDLGAALPGFFDFVSRLGDGERALVHCEVGVSRSASLVIAHVMKTERLRFFEAHRRVRSRRPQVLPNIGFASQLQQLEDALFPQPRSDGHASLTRYLHGVCCVPVEAALLQEMLERHSFDASAAIQAIFDGEIPRVVQGVRR